MHGSGAPENQRRLQAPEASPLATNNEMLDVRSIIERASIETHFQPITSIRRKAVIGLEALTRGVQHNQSQIPPLTLFHSAAAQGLTLELDALCSRTAAQNFSLLQAANADLILFLNFHPQTVAEAMGGAGGLFKLVEQLQLDPRNIALEILESEVEDLAGLKKLVAAYKRQGFLVALDDVGVGYSNLDRIAAIQPDILKIDRRLVQNIDQDYCRQEIFSSLVHLSEKIGGWIVSEGIESQEEALTVLDLGADMMQGFYFAKPRRIDAAADLYDAGPLNGEGGARQAIEATATKFRSHMIQKIKDHRRQHNKRLAVLNSLLSEVGVLRASEFDSELVKIVEHYTAIESLHILDEAGIQVSASISNQQHIQKQKMIIFRLPPKGTDHSLKEYFYLLQEISLNYYITAPYVPLPSGDLCVTIAAPFQDRAGQSFILCVAVRADYGHS